MTSGNIAVEPLLIFALLILPINCFADSKNKVQKLISGHVVNYYNDFGMPTKTISITCPRHLKMTWQSDRPAPGGTHYWRELEITEKKGDSLCACLAQAAPAHSLDTIKCVPGELPLHPHLGEISMSTNFPMARGFVLIEECPVYAPADSVIMNCVDSFEAVFKE